MGRADREPRECHPLQQQLRAALHQVLVDVGAGVALVAVGDDELLRALRLCGEGPLRPGGEARAAAPAHLGGFDLGEEALAAEFAERAPEAAPGAGIIKLGPDRPREDRLGQQAHPVGLGGGAALAGEGALDRPGPRVDLVPDPDRRRGVAEAEADGLGEGDGAVGAALARRQAEPGAQLLDRALAGGDEAGGPGADPHVALPARGQQIVIEGGDAIDGGLGQPRRLGGGAAVGVGQLAVILHRLLQQLECGGGIDRVMTPDQLDEIP